MTDPQTPSIAQIAKMIAWDEYSPIESSWESNHGSCGYGCCGGGKEIDRAALASQIESAILAAEARGKLEPGERELLHGIIADACAALDIEEHPELADRMYVVLKDCDGGCVPPALHSASAMRAYDSSGDDGPHQKDNA